MRGIKPLDFLCFQLLPTLLPLLYVMLPHCDGITRLKRMGCCWNWDLKPLSLKLCGFVIQPCHLLMRRERVHSVILTASSIAQVDAMCHSRARCVDMVLTDSGNGYQRMLSTRTTVSSSAGCVTEWNGLRLVSLK